MEAITHDVKLPLVIKNGAFYRGDKIVPIEIGNSEQIVLLKETDRISANARKDGITAEIQAENIQFEATLRVRCVCGNMICNWKDIEDSGSDYLLDEQAAEYWDRRTVTCRDCGRKYVIREGRAYLKD